MGKNSRTRRTKGMGPLPQSSFSQNLERESIRALRALLPSDRLILHEARAEDFGVDQAIEVIEEGQATNCCAKVQIRARQRTCVKSDSSVSLPVSTANLNYLLNGESPLYILYRPEDSQFRYCWAREEAKRLRSSNPNWKNQKSVTLHFTHVLDTESVEDLCRAILDNSAQARRIHEAIQDVAGYGPVQFQVHPNKQEVTTAEDAARLLREVGIALVSIGQHGHVLEKARLLTGAHISDPHIQLAVGYACYTAGDYLQADAHLGNAQQHARSLEAADARFLRALRDACEFATGRIDASEFELRQQRWTEGGTDAASLQYEIHKLRWNFLTARRSNQRAVYFNRIEEARLRAEQLPDRFQGVRVRARLMWLEAEAIVVAEGFLRFLLASGVGGVMGAHLRGGKNKQEMMAVWFASFQGWEVRIAQLLEFLASTSDARLYCDALLVRVEAREALATHARLTWKVFYNQASDLPAMPNVGLDEDLDRVEELAQRQGLRDIQLRAKLARAKLSALKGEIGTAKELALSVLVSARAQRLIHLERDAEKHISAEGYLGGLELSLRMALSVDQDERMSAYTDEELEGEARDGLRLMNLSESRYLHVLNDYRASRVIAQERLGWCRHIEFQQNLSHTFSKETMYVTEPSRICSCEKLGHQSRFPLPDWEAVLRAFKSAYCNDCGERSPKHPDKT